MAVEKIDDLWEPIPKGVRMSSEYLLSSIPLPPLCIEYNRLSEFLGIRKNTLTYHLNKLEKNKQITKLRDGKILYLTRIIQKVEKNDTTQT